MESPERSRSINLPMTDKRMELVGDNVEDRGDCIRIHFDPEEQNKRAGARDPRIAYGEALYYFLGQTLKETVSHIREGWYGNEWDLPIGHSRRKYPVNCCKLFLTSLEYAATKFMPLCEGIPGTIGNLVVDRTYEELPVAFSIEALVIGLTKEE
jgi:hypothetical protein